MGYDVGNWRYKAEVVAEQTRPGRFGEGSRVIASKAVTRGLWAVWEVRPGEVFIAFELIARRSAGRHSVKSMTEMEGPYYYDCPESFLDLVTVEVNHEWREKVRGYWLERPRRQKTSGQLPPLVKNVDYIDRFGDES